MHFFEQCRKVITHGIFSMIPSTHVAAIYALSVFLVGYTFFSGNDDAAILDNTNNSARNTEVVTLPVTLPTAPAIPLLTTNQLSTVEQKPTHNENPKGVNTKEDSLIITKSFDTERDNEFTRNDETSATRTQAATTTSNNITTIKEVVKSGDSLSKVFDRASIHQRHMYAILNSGENASKLQNLYPGQSIEFHMDENRELQALHYTLSPLKTLSFERTESGYAHRENEKQADIQLSLRTGTIENSLFMAAKKAQLNDRIVMELANIFGWDVDFALDIRKGDSFKILFEETFYNGEKIGDGNILAAEFVNKTKTYRAVRYVDAQGSTRYFTPKGDAMRKAFLRSPIDFARISSHFNLRRKHPVLNKIRAHKGTDYAAITGTPIRSAGDGKVTFSGRKGGYGNVLIIKHGQKYKTLYAHISKFRKGIKKGSRVKQGQVIAYVGSTGLATGPHLHYEFYVDGVVRNPVTVKLPKAGAIPQKELARFLAQTQPLLAQLGSADSPTKVAASESANSVANL